MVQAGDVVVIPAGVAHCNMGQGVDHLVTDAYPGGSDYDVRGGNPAEHELAYVPSLLRLFRAAIPSQARAVAHIGSGFRPYESSVAGHRRERCCRR